MTSKDTTSYDAPSARTLVLIADDAVRTLALPSEGTITFGRDSSCELALDHPSISRQHARLHVGAEIRIEDLGSRNGTRVRGVPLAPHVPLAVRTGDVVECGAAMLVLRDGSTDAQPIRASRALTVGNDGRWFQPEGGGRIDLGRRGALARILLALAKSHAAKGPGLSVHELFEIGWPGERAKVESAQARVYTSIQRLRALGLEHALVTREDGYLLDPAIDVRLEP